MGVGFEKKVQLGDLGVREGLKFNATPSEDQLNGERVVFGWYGELKVIDDSAGNLLQPETVGP